MENVGVVTKVNQEKGFGFIKLDGREKDVFFHATTVVGGTDFKSLKEGDKVSCQEVINTEKGEQARGIDIVLS